MGSDKVWIERNYENCSGCRRCEISCSLHHEGWIWPEASRVRVIMLVPGIEIPHLCFQCEDYPCVDACPTGALSVSSATGAVEADASKCSACGACIDACPGRAPHLHPKLKHVLLCDLCGGDPKCVEACEEGGWGALRLSERRGGFSYRSLAKTPRELTVETARRLLPENVLEEALEP